jgi:hypothetical protein
LWQKERLLNIAVRHLPPACDAVAWLDCDIIFGVSDWAERARTALNDFSMVQLFDEVHGLAQGADYTASGWGPVSRVISGAGLRIARGYLKPETSKPSSLFQGAFPSIGFAWAASRALLDRHGLYDARIGGGGDRAILCAALGRFDSCVRSHSMSDRGVEHYRAWGERFYAEVGGKIGHVSGPVFSLWHGANESRQYEERHRQLAKYDFDPFSDIALGANDCWHWNSAKPGLHQHLKDYFLSRDEDGARSISV